MGYSTGYFSEIGSFLKMVITKKFELGIGSNFLHSIRTSICIRKCNKNWGVISEPFFGKNHGLCYQLAKDYFSLQADLDSLFLWSLSNLEFNSGKVCHLCFHRNGDNAGGIAGSYGTYYLGDRPVDRCSSQRDLGVMLSDDLSWSNHYTLIVSKALNVLGLLRRSFGPSTPVRVKRLLYLSLVRSKLLYCSVVWRPRMIKDIRLLESVQRRATKWILGDYRLDYRSRLLSLKLLPLMMVYEINDVLFLLKSLSFPSPSFDIRNFVSFSPNPYRSSCLLHVLCKDNTCRHFILF